ncbi:uncharacterized protein LY79DRAFT_547051 [Colletotrichum navitas]|uniref:Uncharacterized protein n=1 Tax=Colletotrichum navitas TaxID=681940 RepID=A0AAD8Q3K9_9PEZI|nr:uncharacterized protein LY79DRAFT_547051 [Colletotrichum navitas]KAK1595215.1 hypothetical protein LY79DRAFT_547051 [Colletotrichum navitas]
MTCQFIRANSASLSQLFWLIRGWVLFLIKSRCKSWSGPLCLTPLQGGSAAQGSNPSTAAPRRCAQSSILTRTM